MITNLVYRRIVVCSLLNVQKVVQKDQFDSASTHQEFRHMLVHYQQDNRYIDLSGRIQDVHHHNPYNKCFDLIQPKYNHGVSSHTKCNTIIITISL
jgi:hypothetical protein